MGANKVSDGAIKLTKRFEGFAARPYKCPAGVLTIGYGHTGDVDENDCITEERAEKILKRDLETAERAIISSVKVELTQPQFDALASFIFNVGVGAFKKSSLLRLLNAGKYEEVPAQLMRWNKVAGKPVRGLTNRRQAEADMWISGTHIAPTEPTVMPQAVDAPSKSLALSRTMIGSITSVAGTGTVMLGDAAKGVAGFVDENQQHLSVLGFNMQTVLTVAAVAAIIGSLLAVYARWDDSRKGKL